MTNAIVYSFKGYDTTKHRYILRPAKATLREFAGLMTPSRLQARAKSYRPRWLTVMGFGAQAPNEGCGCPCADEAKSANSPPRVTGAHVAATGSFGTEN